MSIKTKAISVAATPIQVCVATGRRTSLRMRVRGSAAILVATAEDKGSVPDPANQGFVLVPDELVIDVSAGAAQEWWAVLETGSTPAKLHVIEGFDNNV